MNMSNLLISWFKRVRGTFADLPSSGQRVSPAKPRRAFLAVELLEDRLVPATFNVNSLADLSIAAGVNPATGAIGTSHTVTLRSAIDAANMSPVLNFNNLTLGSNTINLMVPGTYKIALPGANTGSDARGAFAILAGGGSLNILNTSGGAVTVDGNHLDRVFDIKGFNSPALAFTVTMQGFTITGGVASPGDGADGSGGGIRDQGNASLTLTNMVVTNNIATGDGGGVSMENIVSEPWQLTVNKSVISYNHAGDAGGGLETDGTGKVFINTGTIITGNTCVNQGAGIWLDDINNSGSVAGVTLANPGGIVFSPTISFASVDLYGSGAQGTAINFPFGSFFGVNITNPGSGYDKPPTVMLGGDDYSLLPPAVQSGISAVAYLALPFAGATLTVNGAIISNNDALNGPGGGIGNAGSGAVTIISSTIENNTSGMAGGGFADQNNAGTLVVANSLILNNVAAGAGGGILEGGPTTTITNTEIAGNASGNSGGGLIVAGTTLFVQNSTIANNTAAGNPTSSEGGGGIELLTTGTGLNASTITDTTISGNRALNSGALFSSAAIDGGGIDAVDSSGDLVLLNDTINANYATEGGGVFGLYRGILSTQNTIVAGNFAALGPDAYYGSRAFTDNGGNLIGVNTDPLSGFSAGTTQTGSPGGPINPLLAPLGTNGGPTIGAPGATQILQTEALEIGSTAIGQGTLSRAPAYDERGFATLVNGLINVGAVSAIVAPAAAGRDARSRGVLDVSENGQWRSHNIHQCQQHGRHP